MSVLEFHIWPRANPVGEGNKLAVLTDADTVGGSMWINPMLHGLGGEAGFTLSRHSALALAANLAEDNIVRVKMPLISAGYLRFGWILSSFENALIDAEREEGGENVTVSGPGLLRMLAWGSLYHSSTVDDQPARGSADREGIWWWIDEPWGAMLTRGIEEGRHSPFPDPAAAGSPLEFLDIDFSRTVDSDSIAWPNIDAEFQVDIGTDLLSLADALRESGNLYLVPDASDVDTLTLHAYQSFGRDLTGAFGAGTVRFERGVNIATNLARLSESKFAITHLLQRDSDGNYSTEIWSGYSAGEPETWGFWDANQTNDDGLLNSIGANVINASRTALEAVQLEIPPGQDPANGLYLWGHEGTGGHFDVGDTITSHTGTGAEEFNEADQLVTAVKVTVREASQSDTETHAERSLKIEPQLNYYAPRYGSGNVGTQAGTVPGCRCIRLCDPLTPGTESLFRFYASSNAAAADPAQHGNWDADSRLSSTRTIKTSPDGTYPSSGTGTTSTAGGDADGRNVIFWSGMSNADIGAPLAAILAAGGATVRGQWPARARFGIGISEANQNMIGNIALRVAQGATTTIRGTALAPHTLASSAGAIKWPAQSAHKNRIFPAVTASNVLSAVSGTVSTDRLVFELGSRNYTLTTSGGAIMLTSDSSDDLLEDETSGVGDNAWIEIRSLSDPTGVGLHPDLIGTDRTASRCDHRHHILANRDPTSADDITQGYPTTTLWTNTDTSQSFVLVDEDTGEWVPFATAGEHTHEIDDVDGLADALEDIGSGEHGELTGLADNDHPQYRLTTDGGQDVINVVAAAGATETLDLATGNVHDVTLTADCTLTLTGASPGVACDMAILLRQGSGAPWLVTWPGSVVWVGDVEPTLETAEDAWNWVALTTLDGGTTWFGSGGGTGSVDTSDLVALGVVGPILIADDHSTPLVFADLLQTEEGDDLLYADIGA